MRTFWSSSLFCSSELEPPSSSSLSSSQLSMSCSYITSTRTCTPHNSSSTRWFTTWLSRSASASLSTLNCQPYRIGIHLTRIRLERLVHASAISTFNQTLTSALVSIFGRLSCLWEAEANLIYWSNDNSMRYRSIQILVLTTDQLDQARPLPQSLMTLDRYRAHRPKLSPSLLGLSKEMSMHLLSQKKTMKTMAVETKLLT